MAEKRRMSNVDAAWLKMEQPNNLMMITGVITFDKPMVWDRFINVFTERIIDQHQRWRMRIDGRMFPVWREVMGYDFSPHFERIELPGEGGEAELEELVAEMMSKPLDLSKPPWHIYLIDNFKGGSALFGRIHHTIADGIALVRLILSLGDETPDAVWISPRRRIRERGLRRIWSNFSAEVLNLISNPRRIFSVFPAASKLLFSRRDPKTVFKGALQIPKRAAWSTPVSLADIKTIGKTAGGTVNDVLMTVMAGALRRYMEERGSAVSQLRAALPVNLKPLDGPIKMGNDFGLVFLPLATGIADPIERLVAVKAEMDKIKQSLEPVVAFGLLNIVGLLPAFTVKPIMGMFGQKVTSVMTNVRGPGHKIYFAGNPVDRFTFWVPQSGGLGLGLSIFSYNGSVSIGVASDTSLVPNPDAIARYFNEEFAHMRTLT